MRQIENYDEITASTGEFLRPTPGGYICRIIDVEDVPLDPKTGKGDYLKIEYDIAYGDLKDYYKDAYDRFGSWWASFVKSYKEKALPMFKGFTQAVEESNKGYQWDWNEKGLIGKFIGLILGEEEYIAQNGEVKTRLYVHSVKNINDIKEGKFKVPAIKKIENVPQSKPADDELPELPTAFGDDLPFN